MGKVADVFKTPGSGLPVGRLVLWSTLLVLVVIALMASRSGLFGPSSPSGSPSGMTPGRPGAGNAMAARVSTDNEGVRLDIHGLRALSPPVDNAPTTVLSVDNGSLAIPRDGTRMSYEEWEAFYAFLRKAWALGKNPPAAPPVAVSPRDLAAAPDHYRGRVVRLRGSLIDFVPKTLNPDNAAPDRPRLYYECYLKLVDEDLSIVTVFEDPLERGIAPRAGGVVWVDACFYRILLYEAQNGTEREAPLLMGYRLVREKFRSPLTPVVGLLIGGFLALVIAMWFLIRRGSRETDAARERLGRVSADELDIPEPRSLPRDKYYEEREKRANPPEAQAPS